MPSNNDKKALLEGANVLERFGFSNTDAAKAANTLAVEHGDIYNMTRLLEERYGFSPEEAAKYATEMTGAKQGWEVYPQASTGATSMEDPWTKYAMTEAYSQQGEEGAKAEAAYKRKTAPEQPQPSPKAYDDKLAKAAALRQKILGY